MIEGRDLLIFGEDFDRHPHVLEHVVRKFLPQNRVLWVETIGMRSPRLSWYDLKRVFEKFKGWLGLNPRAQVKPLPRGLTKLSPFMIPYNQFHWVRRLNRFLVVKKVRSEMRRLKFSAPLLLTSIPSTCDFVGEFGEKLSVYYCVDEFSLWPGIDPEVVGPMEDRLIDKVDLVLTTSRALFEAKRKRHAQTEMLTHGVDWEHFQLRLGDDGKKSLGFFGLIDERLDQRLVREVSDRFPDLLIHFFGTVAVDTSFLSMCPNIVWHGKVSYSELPRAVENISVFLLPYEINELTRHINPLKIKEYLATGRPIVATALDELARFEGAVYLADDAEDFCRGIELSLEKGFNAPEVLGRHLQGETWGEKAEWLSGRILSLERH